MVPRSSPSFLRLLLWRSFGKGLLRREQGQRVACSTTYTTSSTKDEALLETQNQRLIRNIFDCTKSLSQSWKPRWARVQKILSMHGQCGVIFLLCEGFSAWPWYFPFLIILVTAGDVVPFIANGEPQKAKKTMPYLFSHTTFQTARIFVGTTNIQTIPTVTFK